MINATIISKTLGDYGSVIIEFQFPNGEKGSVLIPIEEVKSFDIGDDVRVNLEKLSN